MSRRIDAGRGEPVDLRTAACALAISLLAKVAANSGNRPYSATSL